ncbi:MAG: polyprenyl synthetase family protein [Elusimicrobia bacterium]|nr:polyprenyl synthetase family protein [Elusimicrobiota bacterium]
MELKSYLTKKSKLVEKALKKYLPKDNSLISRAMRYSVFAGGKRLRPILVILGAEICGSKNIADILPAATALEFIHTYSLIHDDLPSMDNDDLRRGKPTSHKKFGEATAILAGDALLTDAFRLMGNLGENKRLNKQRIIDSVLVLAKLAGYKGMIGGQMKDTIETNRWNKMNLNTAKKNLEFIHLNKTAALIQASLLIGATLFNASKKQLNALNQFGRYVGLAFQAVDDILDITADKKLLGKRGSDLENNKLTYPSLYGLEESQNKAKKLIINAKKSLNIFGKKAEILSQLADYIIQRQY